MCAPMPSCPIYAELGTEAKGLHILGEPSTRFLTCGFKERFYFWINHISLYLKSKNTFIFHTTPSPIFHTCVSWFESLGASQSFASFVSERAKIQGCEPLWAPSNMVNYIQIPRSRMSHGFAFFLASVCMPGVKGSQKRALGPLEPELLMAVNYHVGTWDQTLFFCKSNKCSNL